jgi:hypothetical protein
VKFIRLKSIQQRGETLSQTMARLSPVKGITKPTFVPAEPVTPPKVVNPPKSNSSNSTSIFVANSTRGAGIAPIPLNRLLVGDDVQNLIDSFNNQQTTIGEFDSMVQSMNVNGGNGLACQYQAMSYSHATGEFINVDNINSGLFPGSILQSKFLNGVLQGNNVPVAIDPNYLMSSTIRIYDPHQYYLLLDGHL